MAAIRGVPAGSVAFNVHNQGLRRADYQGPRGSGFFIEFLGARAARKLEEDLDRDALAFAGAGVEAVIRTTDDVKQRIRTYLDAVFTGSAMHGNEHRRVSNAASQSIYYNDVSEKGQFTGLIYSKFGRGRGPGNFVDFLLLHLRGGTLRPTSGEWIRIPNPEIAAAGGLPFRPQSGSYPSGQQIFFAKSKDGQKLFQLRRRGRTTELLATLVKSITVPARLGGLDVIANSREATFHRFFDELANGKGV